MYQIPVLSCLVIASEMSVFLDRYIAVEFGTRTSFKTKQELRKLITDHGGIVSFIITRKVISCCVNYFRIIIIHVLAVVVILKSVMECNGAYVFARVCLYVCEQD